MILNRDRRIDPKAFLKAWNETFQKTGISPCSAEEFLVRYFEAEAANFSGDAFERACDAVVALSESGKASEWRSQPVEVIVRTAFAGFIRHEPKPQNFWLWAYTRWLGVRAWFWRKGW